VIHWSVPSKPRRSTVLALSGWASFVGVAFYYAIVAKRIDDAALAGHRCPQAAAAQSRSSSNRRAALVANT
jgi:hypothetical protein